MNISNLLTPGLNFSKKIVTDLNQRIVKLLCTKFQFFLDLVDSPQEIVKVETSVLNISHKKRKDVTSLTSKVLIGIADVPINPPDSHPIKFPTISISNESFNTGGITKTFILFLKVFYATSPTTNGQICESEGKR